MIRTIIWFMYFWGYLVWVTPKLYKANRLKIGSYEHKKYINKYITKWTKNLIHLAGADVTVYGRENIPHQTAVYVANHQGNFDVALMLAYVGEPRAMLAKSQMEKMPVVCEWMRHLGCIFVDRNDKKQSLKAVLSAIKYVKAGNSMTIFPEGTRSKGKPIGEFKSGSSVIAIKGGALIVPVTIDGSHKIMESNFCCMIKPSNVKITIHKPIDVKNLTKDELENIDNMLQNTIKSALNNA